MALFRVVGTDHNQQDHQKNRYPDKQCDIF